MKSGLNVIVVLMGLILSACGSKEEASKEDLSYSFDSNGCKTGEHSFSSTAEYCKGLQDDKLNNGCAAQFRNEEYQRRCQ